VGPTTSPPTHRTASHITRMRPACPPAAGQAREDYVLEAVYWDAGTARLLPRLLNGRTRGPVFVTRRRPAPGKVVSPRDVCPDTGLARLSYGQARALLDEHTAVGGPGTGWDLQEYRNSSARRTQVRNVSASAVPWSAGGHIRAFSRLPAAVSSGAADPNPRPRDCAPSADRQHCLAGEAAFA
jgi:hypothetical protein